MAGLEQAAPVTPDYEVETEEPIKKIESSDSSGTVDNNLDYNLNKVDEQKFKDFRKMTDYIKNSREYRDEYNDIVNKAITSFEEQIQKLVGNNKDIKDTINSMDDEALQARADEILKDQPEELKSQQELIAKINLNGSPKEIQKLNEIVNMNMSDVKSFYEKITKDKVTKERAD